MIAEIEKAHTQSDTLGGVVEIWAENVPPGLGSVMHFDSRLDGRLAFYLMSIPSIKGVNRHYSRFCYQHTFLYLIRWGFWGSLFASAGSISSTTFGFSESILMGLIEGGINRNQNNVYEKNHSGLIVCNYFKAFRREVASIGILFASSSAEHRSTLLF